MVERALHGSRIRIGLFAAAVLLGGAPLGGAYADQVMRVGMTASDLPTTGGIPNNGGEGFRFLGFPVFDSLVNWDFKHPDETADVTPGLATSWEIDEVDHTRWIFHLRHGVKFHDGTDFNADAVIFTLGRIYDDKSPQFDATSSPIVRAVVSMLQRWEKIDYYTIAIYTNVPFSHFPYLVTRILIVSPTAWEKAGRSWTEFAKAPAGTGPFKITKVTPRVSVEMARNPDYWDKDRIPKLDRMIVMPMPEANTRVAALRSGQVDWIEVPPPDMIDSLKSAGFQISLWPYPHTWPYVLNVTGQSPFRDKLVRQAANYAVDRDGLVKLLNGTATPAPGLYPVEHPVYGNPQNHYTYDPERAKALLKQAGHTGPVKAKIMISTSGSGQMMPLPMNEFLQQSMQAAGFDLDFEVVEWGAMLLGYRSAPDAPASKGVDALNISLSYTDPSSMFRYWHSASYSPINQNWGHWSTPQLDGLLQQAQDTFDPGVRDKILAEAHALVVDEAPWIWIVHDLNPRAMSSHVKGFRPAQSWSQDFTTIWME
jgi:peptide/nickel transport system substrate-binding protein